jgi:hypothetical protein
MLSLGSKFYEPWQCRWLVFLGNLKFAFVRRGGYADPPMDVYRSDQPALRRD